ncbi:MAG: FAD-dependent oxidoreductase [Gammaproteobacteria bacterium]|nr:FAD-dependent oxidoreductase [Gammaproteobacteria bacterium]
MNNHTKASFVVIGAGPAALCALAKLLEIGIHANEITWIDPEFKVGDFGSKLSVGSSVPGNTSVASYQRVNKAIYKILVVHPPLFEIDNLAPDVICSLKIAAEPMQYITHELRKRIISIEGYVTQIQTVASEFKIEIKLSNNTFHHISSKRVIIATGSHPRSITLAKQHKSIKLIDPNITFIESELKKFLAEQQNAHTIAVIGSSHSAALAAMHLLQAGVTVHQFMNKDYKYAAPCISPEGIPYTMYDNTGLKGEVAKFTKKLISDLQENKSIYQHKIKYHMGKNTEDVFHLLENNLHVCSHAVAAIGYEITDSLSINNNPITDMTYNKLTLEFDIPMLYGIGIAFPQELKAISGEVESAVGYGKFWTSVNDKNILDAWKKNYKKQDKGNH